MGHAPATTAVIASLALTGTVFARVDCESLRLHQSRSEEAFPARVDKKSRLRYPIRDALEQLIRSCDGSVPEVIVAQTIEATLDEELKRDTYQIVILALTSCDPCMEEFPKYASFAKAERDVTFVFVDADAHPDGLETYARERFEFERTYEPPAYIVLDTDGEPLARSSGRDGLRRALNWLAKYRRERDKLLRKSARQS